MSVALSTSALRLALMGTLVSLSAVAASAADLPTRKAPAMAGCVQAVDGINGEVSGFGGTYGSSNLAGGAASLSVPLGCEFGAQVDAGAASFGGRALSTVGGHLFWRDPSRGLVGLYGSYMTWDRAGGVRAAHVGPEAELYLGRWTLQGTAGAEFGNTTRGFVGPLLTTWSVPSRFYDQLNAAYYLQDNFKAYVGHRYLAGRNALALGGEYGIAMGNGMMASLFAEGRIGERNSSSILGGVKVYFGQKNKTLIRRHREDDPTQWSVGSDGAAPLSNTITVAQPNG